MDAKIKYVFCQSFFASCVVPFTLTIVCYNYRRIELRGFHVGHEARCRRRAAHVALTARHLIFSVLSPRVRI